MHSSDSDHSVPVSASCVWAKLQPYRRPFLILWIYTLLVQLPLLVLRLTNDLDGLWNQDDYLAGTWELSIGRWFWPFLDKMRFGISLDPLPAVFSLALYSLSFLLILRLLDLIPSGRNLLAGCLFLGSVGIVCQMSFGYMAITFAVSFFLAVLAVWVLLAPVTSSAILRILLSALCIAFMMGSYQAGIGTTALLMLFVLLYSIAAEGGTESAKPAFLPADARKRLRFFIRAFCSVALGGILYVLLLKLRLWMTGTPASDYQGFSEISPLYILAGLPNAFHHCYRTILNYFVNGTYLSHALERHSWFPLCYMPVFILVCVVFVRIFRRKKTEALLFLAGILLIPAAANCFYLAAPETETHMQMVVSMALILPLLFCMSNYVFPSGKAALSGSAVSGGRASSFWKSERCLKGILLLDLLFLLYGGILQCEMDQYGMYAGRRASQTLAQSILTEAGRQGYDYADGQLLIVGPPASSKTFYTAPLFERANAYAQYGRWSNDISFSRISWSRLYTNYLRIQVSFAQGDTEATISTLPEVAAMPAYPAAGSVQNIYGVLVVKLQN